MEGIQHRLDCPVAKGAVHDKPVRVTDLELDPAGVIRIRCPYCHRAALMLRPKGESDA